MTKFKNFVVGFLSILFLIIFSFLFVLSLFTTGLYKTYEKEIPVLVNDNVFINIILIALTVIVFYILYKLVKKYIDRNVLLLVCVIVCVGFSILWVLSSNEEPIADQTAVCLFAHYFNEYNYFGLNRGEYVGIYQQQLGLIHVIQLVFEFFGDSNHTAFQLMNTLFIGLFVVSNDMIIRNSHLKYKDDAEIFYLLLVMWFVPLFIYSDFVYGDVMSIGCISFCLWMLISFINDAKVYKLLLAIFSGFLSSYVRLNSIIFIIAAILVLLVSMITEFNKKKLFTLLGVVLAGIMALKIPEMVYGIYIPEDSYSMPPTLHISMGMQGDAGWYNDYNIITYQSTNYDPIEANNWAKEDINNRLDEFKKNPNEALNFYYNKINLQWNSPMFQAFVMNQSFKGNTGRIATTIYKGSVNKIINVVVNCHQMFVYLMCVVFSINIFKDRENIKMEELIFVVFVIGGFFFSILWEAKTRYILPYYSVLLIEAAFGFSYLKNKLFANRHLFN